MTRDEILEILNTLDGLVVDVGPYRLRASDPAWSLPGKWLVLDLRLIAQGPVSQTLPATVNWAAVATALGLDTLTTTDRGGIRVSDIEARLWASFA